MIGRKYLENWWAWIAANLLYIPLYMAKEWPYLAAVQIVFIALSVMGWKAWRKEFSSRKSSALAG